MRIKRPVKSGKKTYTENRGIQELIKNRYKKTTKIIFPMSFLIDANRVLWYNVRADSCDKAEVQSEKRGANPLKAATI
jgi:hypothetical protein